MYNVIHKCVKKMKIQRVILAMFLSIYVICIKLMTNGNVFGLETLLSPVTGMVFSTSTKSYRIVAPISRKTKYHRACFINVKYLYIYMQYTYINAQIVSNYLIFFSDCK